MPNRRSSSNSCPKLCFKIGIGITNLECLEEHSLHVLLARRKRKGGGQAWWQTYWGLPLNIDRDMLQLILTSAPSMDIEGLSVSSKNQSRIHCEEIQTSLDSASFKGIFLGQEVWTTLNTQTCIQHYHNRLPVSYLDRRLRNQELAIHW